MSATYAKLAKAQKSANDNRSCGVLTLAALTGLSFEESAIVLDGCGRRKHNGTTMKQLSDALGIFGYRVRVHDKIDNQRNFIIFWQDTVSGEYHVSAMLAGELVDYPHRYSAIQLFLVDSF